MVFKYNFRVYVHVTESSQAQERLNGVVSVRGYPASDASRNIGFPSTLSLWVDNFTNTMATMPRFG